MWEDSGISHCAWFGALQDKGDAGLMELPAPGLEHRADEGRLRDRSGSVQPRKKMGGRFHCCLARRHMEDRARLFPMAHSGEMKGTSWKKGNSL